MRRALLLLICSAVYSAAQAPALIQNVFNAASSASASGPVNNVGQIGHSAYLTFTNAPSHTCTTPAATAQLEYSFDNSTWIAFGAPQSGTTVMSGQAYIGQGGFGYVRFNLVSFDTTNCRATVWYVGTAQPLAIQLSGPIGSTGTLVVCDHTATASPSAGVVTQMIAAPSSGQIRICEIQISTASTPTSAFNIGYGTSVGAGCVGTPIDAGTNILPQQTIGAGSTTFGSNLGQLVPTVPVGKVVCAESSGASTVLILYAVF